MDSSEVQILCRKLLKPSTSTSQHPQNYKLSLFDQLAPPSCIRIFLCYRTCGALEKAESFSSLKRSLSDTLTKFYPLAGRILEDDLSVDCSDQGIEYLEAEVSRGLDEFLHDGLGVEILDQFVPKDVSGADLIGRPLASVQINKFRCGGIALGLRVSHKILDTSTLITFINGWATISQVGISSVVSPTFDVPSIFPSAEELTTLYSRSLPLSIGTRIASRRFTFKGSVISKFRTRFRETISCINHQPSRVTVVTAVIWKALINISQTKYGHLRPSLLAPAMSLRGKAALKTLEISFGNLWMPAIARYKPDDKGKLDLLDLVSILDDAVRGTAEIIKKASRDEIFSMAINSIREVIDEKLLNDRVDVFACTSWCRFPTNEADFGWGKPCWVSSLSRPYEMFTLWDSRFGDSIEALVCLNEKDMPQFNLDADLSTFTSSTEIGKF